MLTSMRAGFGGLRGEMDRTNRSGGYVSNQLRALSTTMRYAFAGSAIFGTLQMVRNLGEFQAKLGEISAIATGPGGLPIVGRELDQLGSDLLRVSNETTQPIEDLQQGVISLYSTIGDVPENQAANIMNTISEASITAQSNVEDTTQALLGMIDAFGRGTNEIPKFGNEFFKVIQLSAGMPGHIYAQQLGRLSASARLGQFSPEQMGALAVGATRFGGSPATNMRGLAQLMTFAMNPTGKAEKAFEGIGLGRSTRTRLGGYETLRRILEITNSRGGARARGMTDDQVSAISDAFGDNVTNQQAGLSGPGSALLAKLFPRIEGRRIAGVLSQLMTENQVAGTPNKTLDEYLQEITNSTGAMDKAMAKAMDRRRITQAANAMHNLGIETGNALSPWLQLPARGITAFTEGFGGQSGHERQAEIVGGTIGMVALLRGLGKGGAVARGAPMVGAGLDALTQHQRGYTPLNPLFVAVVYSMSGPGSLFSQVGNIPAGGAGGAGQEVKNATKAGRFGRIARALGRVTIVGAVAEEAYQAAHANEKSVGHHALLNYLRQGERPSGFVDFLKGPFGHGLIHSPPKHTPAEQAVLDQLKSGTISKDEAERRLRRITTHPHLSAAGIPAIPVAVTGKAHITIDQTQNGTRVKRSHVTVDLFPDFSPPIGTSKGKNKSYRGGP